MEVQTTFYVERDGEDIELHIFGEAEPDVPGCRRGHPDNWTPDDPGYSGLTDIAMDEDGNEPWDGELTDEEKREAESALMDALKEDIRHAREDAAIERAEAAADDAAYFYDQDYGDYGPDIYDF